MLPRYYASRFGFVTADNPYAELIVNLPTARARFLQADENQRCSAISDRVLSAVLLAQASSNVLGHGQKPLATNASTLSYTMQISVGQVTDRQFALLRLAVWPCEALSSFVVDELMRSGLSRLPFATFVSDSLQALSKRVERRVAMLLLHEAQQQLLDAQGHALTLSTAAPILKADTAHAVHVVSFDRVRALAIASNNAEIAFLSRFVDRMTAALNSGLEPRSLQNKASVEMRS